jgi:hypothetical protein
MPELVFEVVQEADGGYVHHQRAIPDHYPLGRKTLKPPKLDQRDPGEIAIQFCTTVKGRTATS